ncbi:hypothetical protein AB1Y20_001771 [Prymnesium parvum]|uniref:Uncharacterized protein n=1 Tax=Prymnesium parvum TaxID=97485 RepID=A0AB34KCP2_PRYPA
MQAAGLARLASVPPQPQATSAELILDIERLLRGPPLPARHTLERIHALLSASTAGSLELPTAPPPPPPPPPPQPVRRGTVEINSVRTHQIRALQRRMESDPAGGMGSRLSRARAEDEGAPRVAETFTQRAHLLANQPEVRRGHDHDRDMRFDPVSHRRPLPPEPVWFGRR